MAVWGMAFAETLAEEVGDFITNVLPEIRREIFYQKRSDDRALAVRHASRAAQSHPDGGQFGRSDSVWLPARTTHPRVGPQYAWCLPA